MQTASDKQQLELIRRSMVDPSAENKAKELLLTDIYTQVRVAYGDGIAPNGGKLAHLPSCVKASDLCQDDLQFPYNAIRVLMARYMTRNEHGLFMETPSMVYRRVAEGFSNVLGKKKANMLYKIMISGRFVFNSPTLFNMYVNGARGTLSACYVTPVYDDMSSIMDAAHVQAMTFKWGGGQGFSFSELRPRWDAVRGTSSVASGPVSFMRLYDMVTEVVKQGGKRRGANMGIMHIWHPDIFTPGFDSWTALANSLPPIIRNILELINNFINEVESEGYEVDKEFKEVIAKLLNAKGFWSVEDAGFIQAKEPPLHDTYLTNFNISVAVNDAFMKAVMDNDEWLLVNPRYSEKDGIYTLHYSVSKATGLGKLGMLVEKAPWLLENPYLNLFEDVVDEAVERALRALYIRSKLLGFKPNLDIKNQHVWRIKARQLWDKIVENAWLGGDPGLFFVDNHNKWNPTPWLGVVVATNPCGEQPLYPFESCNLGSIALDKYVKCSENKQCIFDLHLFYEDLMIIVEAMDAIIDLNKHPDPRQDVANKFTRKIGLGVMGLADALAKLEIPYDSEEAVAFTLISIAALEVFAWKRSWELGAEKGHAPAFECKRFNWKTMKCVEKEEPERLVELHTPALVKAADVIVADDIWIKVKYHNVNLSSNTIKMMAGAFRERIEADGSVKLIRKDVISRVLRKVFGVNTANYQRALHETPTEIANDPHLLLALAIFSPSKAWEVLKTYGRLRGAKAPRNTVVTTIAPTGTISILAGTSSGIEPYFALVYKRRVTVGEFLEVVNKFRDKLLSIAKRYSVDEDTIMDIYAIISRHKGSLRWAIDDIRENLLTRNIGNGFLAEVEKLATIFATAMDFDPWYHLAHQIAAQLYVDQAISKTINLPKNADKTLVNNIYFVAWLAGLKGVTVYRDESKSHQVIVFGAKEEHNRKRLLRKRSRMRMMHLKKNMRLDEIKRDKKLNEIFETKEKNGTITVELTQNSTCTTCEL